MHTIAIHNKHQLECPEHLGEFTNDQYLYFCDLLVSFNANQITYHNLRVKLIYKLLDMQHSSKKLSPLQTSKRNENIYRLSLLVDGLFTEKIKENKTVKTLNLTFVDNKIPEFIHQGIKYYGPEKALLNVSFDEFIFALESYNSFNNSNNIDDLNNLVAALYRPAKPLTEHNKISNYDGDIRQEFYRSNVGLRANELADLDSAIKMGVKLFFEACISYISTATEVPVQGNFIDLTVLFKGNSNKDKGVGMLNVLFSLAETNVFGDMEKTGKQLYWTILLKLYQNHIDNENHKKQLEDAKRNRVK